MSSGRGSIDNLIAYTLIEHLHKQRAKASKGEQGRHMPTSFRATARRELIWRALQFSAAGQLYTESK
jgi:hypothetical protein